MDKKTVLAYFKALGSLNSFYVTLQSCSNGRINVTLMVKCVLIMLGRIYWGETIVTCFILLSQ
jgi:hypothetical protein